jgi:hypothetical protein
MASPFSTSGESQWRMSKAHDFNLALTRVIEPTGGPGAELVTLEDAALRRCDETMASGATALDFAAELLLKSAETREEDDIQTATTQRERALRVDGWLLCHVMAPSFFATSLASSTC